MKKFGAIEGLRGWLAWMVVFDHLALTTNIYAKGVGPQIIIAGHYAVMVFIIISGFVITHLILDKHEPYGPYLIRRFMRIFPLFAVTCFVGYFTADLYADALTRVPWANEPFFIAARIKMFTGIAHTDRAFFWPNVLAHASMLHGMLGNQILPVSQYAFLPPAWSISLEWQFYLMAPFIVRLVRQLRWIASIALAVFVCEIAYNNGLFGEFENPSLILGSAGYFALGIASRLAYPRMAGSIAHPSVIFALVLVLLPFGWQGVPVLIWALVMAGLCLDAQAVSSPFAAAYGRLLEGPVARYFGSRSFSVYLCHFPVMTGCLVLWLQRFPSAGRYSTFLALAAMTLPLTVAAAEVLYRCVERPGIALGSRWAGSLLRGQPAARVFIS